MSATLPRILDQGPSPAPAELFNQRIHRDPPRERTGSWIVCQIGAREHYAVPRALHRIGELADLMTDFWIPPGHAFAAIPGARRLQDRFHPDLVHARVWAPSVRMLAFEARQRWLKWEAWPATVARNGLFQKGVIATLNREYPPESADKVMTLFSYSYAARELFKYAKSRGWRTVLGQIDPGPEEEQIVREEHSRYPELGSRWQPTPDSYWKQWREEVELADKIVVNSRWSMDCLIKENVPPEKMKVIPLVYEERSQAGESNVEPLPGDRPVFRLLFLGQINLRKGIGRLIEAMRLLRGESIELVLAGPSEMDAVIWQDLNNVRWVGPVPRSKVKDYYRNADAFILPTLSDGYALTQLEAMSRGVPVIASRHCGQAVIPGQNGWLLDDLEPITIRDLILEARNQRNSLGPVVPPPFRLDDLAASLIAI